MRRVMMSLYKRIFPFLAFMSVCGCQLEALHVNGDECSPSFSNGMSVETGSITCYKDHMEGDCIGLDGQCLSTTACLNCKRDFNDCKRYQADFDLLVDNASSPNRLFVSSVNDEANLDTYRSLFYNGKLNVCPTDAPRCAWTKDDDGAIASFECLTCQDDICGNQCVDLKSDDENCGACGRECTGGTTCRESKCVCTSNLVLCNNNCIDPKTNHQFCGASGTCQGENSGTTCGGNQKCNEGVCELTTDSQCPTGEHKEGNTCVEDSVDACGLATVRCTALAGWLQGECNDRQCQAKRCKPTYHLDGIRCAEDTNDCCGVACSKCPEDEYCVNGKCESTCNDLTPCTDLNHKTTCADLQYSTSHCGGCNNLCVAHGELHPNSTSVLCNDGRCIATSCDAGYHVYEGNCEPDSPERCGPLAVNCLTSNYGCEAAECNNGKCVVTQCNPKFFIDDNNTCRLSDNDNCGAIDHRCSAGEFCSLGECKSTCEPDQTPCTNQDTGSVTCADLDTNPDNCGACGVKCNTDVIPNSIAVECNRGCKVTHCSSKYHIYDNTCELNDIDNCGTHGNRCNAANAINYCKSGVENYECDSTCIDDFHKDENGECVPDTPSACGPEMRNCKDITPWWIDGECRKGGKCYATKCDTSKSHVYNGTCEENDNDHCGAHNSPCSSEEVCKSGVCARFCNTNETICEFNGNRSCRNLNTDRDHCGQCNKACIKSDLAGIVTCENTKCIEGNCKLGSHFNENTNRCEPDTDLACGDKLINCNNAIPNSKETFCESAVCKLKRCKDGFHVDTSKQTCVEDTDSCCGPNCLQCLNPSYGKAVCKNGKCDVECNDGYTRCETPSPRCTDLNEASACGSCTNQCTEKPANATAVCINKTCSFKCDPGYAECTSGQCVSTNTTSHCGTCNNRCLLVPNGSPSCDNGKCIITCNSGYFLKNNQCVSIGSGCPGTFIDCNLDGSKCCKTFEDCNNPKVACFEVAPLEPLEPIQP